MGHRTFVRVTSLLAFVVLLGATIVLAGCAGDEPTVPETPIAADENGSSTTENPDEPSSDAGGDEPSTPSTVTFSVYWVEAGENALGVQRTVPYTEAVATAAMTALLGGPTQEELTTWPALSTAIPAGSRLLGLTVSDGVAAVDLSREFESGGGTFSVTARLAQVVYTLEQFPTVDAVEFYIEGERVQTFSSEGLTLDGPQTLDDYDELLPIDA